MPNPTKHEGAPAPPKYSLSDMERAARNEIEATTGHPLTDDDWQRQANRIKDYFRMLSRWDVEQRGAKSRDDG